LQAALNNDGFKFGANAGLRRELQADWSKKHSMYMHADQKNLDHVPKPKVPLCRAIGFCVCQGKGKEAYHFHQNMRFLLKPFFTPKQKSKKQLTAVEKPIQVQLKASKKLLRELFIVVKLRRGEGDAEEQRPHLLVDDGWGHWGSVAEQILAGDPSLAPTPTAEPQQPASNTLWFHIGTMNYSSWHCSLLQLEAEGRGVEQNTCYIIISRDAATAVVYYVCC
jgi:hypothetical protein